MTDLFFFMFRALIGVLRLIAVFSMMLFPVGILSGLVIALFDFSVTVKVITNASYLLLFGCLLGLFAMIGERIYVQLFKARR